MNTFKPYKDLAPVSQALDGSVRVLSLPQPARSNDVIRVVVSGTKTARVQPGLSSQAASSTVSNGVLMLSNSVETFTLDQGVSHIAVDGASGSTVEINLGTGL